MTSRPTAWLVSLAFLIASCGSTSLAPTEPPSTSLAPTASGEPGTAFSPLPTATQAPSGPAPTGLEPSAAVRSAVPPPTVEPTPIAASSAAPIPRASAPWRNAGVTAIDSEGIGAVALTDGRVLALGQTVWCPDDYGDDGYGDVGGDPVAQLWDPTSERWRATTSLPRPRDSFAMVTLADGRVLVAGGRSADGRSFSSTYLFDPRPGHETWAKAGLLGTARTSPGAVLLRDGHVLILGGYYQSGAQTGRADPPDAVVAAFEEGGASGIGRDRPGPLHDMDPGPWPWPTLATAELFDPATGTWTPTGAMHYARSGARAVTLVDGRVLVVGQAPRESYRTPELYDPRTGRFTLTGDLPDFDPSTIAELGDRGLHDFYVDSVDDGTLVALEDGGALLVGRSGEWKHVGGFSRSFRFDAGTGQWSEIGEPFVEIMDDDHDGWLRTSGVDRTGALAASIEGGRVLVVGGRSGDRWSPSRSAEIYHPSADRWSSLPPLPEARSSGVTIPLADGSVLIVGGHGGELYPGCTDPARSATAIRYVPGP